MSLLSTILNFFGTKSQRDMKELTPIVEKILITESEISKLSNDKLRNKTIEFKSILNNSIKIFDDQINELKAQIETENNRDIQEEIYKKIDTLELDKHKEINNNLDSIKIEAFCVIKETARRFTENENITVSATDLDIQLDQS